MAKKNDNWNDMDELLCAIRDSQKNQPRRNRTQESRMKIHDTRILAGMASILAFVAGCAVGLM